MYLIDTHIIIRMLYKPDELPENVRNILDNEQCFYSVASLWEMAIKIGLKKLSLKQSMKQIADSLEESGIRQKAITAADCDIVKSLPSIHKDPFDRIIISQAMADRMTIVTKDSIIPKYDVDVAWD